MGEVMITCEKLRFTIAKGESWLAREYRSVAALLAFTKTAYVEYQPLGVIGVIVPWNYPFHNVLSAATAALMAGNGCVIKVSEYASWGAPWIENMFREVLANRGYDPELVQVITGMGETGNALVTCGVDKVLFIGSPGVGKLVMKAASATLTPVILELGGKDPFIVFSDAEFDHCIDIAIRGAFINCGQSQSTISRAQPAGTSIVKSRRSQRCDCSLIFSLLICCASDLCAQTASAPNVSTSRTPCTTSSSLR